MLFLRIVRLLMLLCLLGLGAVSVLILALLEGLTRSPSRQLALAGLWYRLLLWVMNVRVQHRGKYRHQGAMICANHISWLDIPVLGSQIPTYFLSKAELKNVPLLGWMAHRAGTLFIRRGTGQIAAVKALIETYLSQDHCLTFFPETTTGNGFAIRRFHPRLFSAAIDSGTPVLPVAIEYHEQRQPDLLVAFSDEGLGTNLWRVLGRWRTDVTVTILPLLPSQGQPRRTLADTAMHQIADALNLPAERRGLDLTGPLPVRPKSAPQDPTH